MLYWWHLLNYLIKNDIMLYLKCAGNYPNSNCSRVFSTVCFMAFPIRDHPLRDLKYNKTSWKLHRDCLHSNMKSLAPWPGDIGCEALVCSTIQLLGATEFDETQMMSCFIFKILFCVFIVSRSML